MANRKDNPHKPGTDEHKTWEKENVLSRDYFGILQDDDREESVIKAHARMRSVAEVEKAKYEKKEKYLDVLDFIENQDTPEYDPILDNPKKDVDKSAFYKTMMGLTDPDPLNWKDIVLTLKDMYINPATFNWIAPYPRVPTVAFSKYVPPDSTEADFLMAHGLVLRTEYDKATWELGWVRVLVPKRFKIPPKRFDANPLIASAGIDYSAMTFEFWIK